MTSRSCGRSSPVGPPAHQAIASSDTGKQQRLYCSAEVCNLWQQDESRRLLPILDGCRFMCMREEHLHEGLIPLCSLLPNGYRIGLDGVHSASAKAEQHGNAVSSLLAEACVPNLVWGQTNEGCASKMCLKDVPQRCAFCSCSLLAKASIPYLVQGTCCT